MAAFSARSLKILSRAHPALQRVMTEAIRHFNFSIICSTRGKEDQQRAFTQGKSRARFGQSPHNFTPSLAVDCVPFPLNWDDLDRFDAMGLVILTAASDTAVPINWGRNFKGIVDYPHFEISGWQQLAKRAGKVDE